MAALAACASAAAHAGSTTTVACGPKGATTLAASRVARVYVTGNRVYGCSRHGTRTLLLGQRATCEGNARVDPVAVEGEIVAYGSERCFVDTGNTAVIVRRLSDGKTLRSAAATSPPGVESFQSVGSLVLKRDGAVAWIGLGSSIGLHNHKTEVYKADSHGSVQLLDAGGAIRSGSLVLNGSRLSWKHGDTVRHATLS
jgi:hypothetical protein